MKRCLPLFLLLAPLAPHALGQFQLVQVTAAGEQALPPVFSFAAIDAGSAASVSLRLRNTGSTAAPVSGITLAGVGFMLVAPPLPASVDPQGTFDFAVGFQPASPGSFSATLQAAGISVLFTGTANPALTYQVIVNGTAQALNPPLDFGAVTIGSGAVLQLLVLNQTGQLLQVPAVAVSGTDFSLSGPSPSGTLLQPFQSAPFALAFTPTQPGLRAGNLAAGSHTYPLTGTGQSPPLPKASLLITLPQPSSAEQGSLAVTLDSAPLTAASGTLTMSFTPASGVPANEAVDPSIAFASGGQTAAFTVAAGAISAQFGGQPSIAFATGTTAGTLTFTVQFGGATTRQNVPIAAVPVGISGLQATRQSASITVQAQGFDNTRTAGQLTFTFYDALGNPVPPGAIPFDATTGFAAYFGASPLGGAFSLTAVFPITGNPSRIASFEIGITNSAGTTRSPRTVF
jgi:hypothetical protein